MRSGPEQAMDAGQVTRRRRALLGAAVAAAASLGLIAFPLLARAALSETALLLLVFGFTIAMGGGAILAVFSLGGGKPGAS